MRFYHISILSVMLLGLFYLAGTGLLAALWLWLRKRWKRAWIAMLPLFILLYAAPVAEEFWIAWHFGQLCKKDAGIFIHKAVEVEGFYDATMRSAYENTKPGGYQFVEHATEDRKGFERVQRASEEERARALAWYAEANPGKERPKDKSIFHNLNERERVVVFPGDKEAWRVTGLDRPSARYHYRWPHSHTPVAYKVKSHEWVIEDVEQKTVIAREKAYAREAYWFYIGLDRPTMFCPVFGSYGEKLTGGLYRLALRPSK